MSVPEVVINASRLECYKLEDKVRQLKFEVTSMTNKIKSQKEELAKERRRLGDLHKFLLANDPLWKKRGS